MNLINKFDIVWIAPIYDCNNHCSWCYAASNTNKYLGHKLDVDLHQPISNLLDSLNVKKVTIVGGEPTIYDGLYNLLEKLFEKYIKVGIVSNGRKLRDKNFTQGLKCRGVESIAVSLEGPDAEIHDSITCAQGSFYETLGGILTAKDLEINVNTNTVISSHNINSLEKLLELLKNIGVNSASFNICGPCLSVDSNSLNMIDIREAANAFERAYSYSKLLGIKTRLITPIPSCFFKPESLTEFKKTKAAYGGPCQLVHGRNFVIDYNGDVLPCTHFTGFPLFNVFEGGKFISKEEFINKYNDEDGLAFLLRAKMSKYPSEKCTRSDCGELCTGGCPLFWIRYDPDELISPKSNSEQVETNNK
jgi:radical SAM protein with 4Fe4S-binding SPASM domain